MQEEVVSWENSIVEFFKFTDVFQISYIIENLSELLNINFHVRFTSPTFLLVNYLNRLWNTLELANIISDGSLYTNT